MILRRLLRNRSGVAMTEFALAAPFVLTFGLWGIEISNLALTNMKVSQVAMHLADNASRIGDTSVLADRKIYESDINDVLYGANLQGGESLDLYEHGRVIISSLEVLPAGGGGSGSQYIHWQRCKGKKNHTSSYGVQGANLGTAGMGPTGYKVVAQPDDAVIFVEVVYDYQPLVSARFVSNTTISATAAFTVRDDRDLSQIYAHTPATYDNPARCNQFNSTLTRVLS